MEIIEWFDKYKYWLVGAVACTFLYALYMIIFKK